MVCMWFVCTTIHVTVLWYVCTTVHVTALWYVCTTVHVTALWYVCTTVHVTTLWYVCTNVHVTALWYVCTNVNVTALWYVCTNVHVTALCYVCTNVHVTALWYVCTNVHVTACPLIVEWRFPPRRTRNVWFLHISRESFQRELKVFHKMTRTYCIWFVIYSYVCIHTLLSAKCLSAKVKGLLTIAELIFLQLDVFCAFNL